MDYNFLAISTLFGSICFFLSRTKKKSPWWTLAGVLLHIYGLLILIAIILKDIYIVESPDAEDLSHNTTWTYKFIFYPFFPLPFIFGGVSSVSSGDKIGYIILLTGITLGIFFFPEVFKIKKVYLKDNYLLVSNFFKISKIPLDQIVSLNEQTSVSPHKITITFKSDKIICFFPKDSRIFSESDTYKKLSNLIDNKVQNSETQTSSK